MDCNDCLYHSRRKITLQRVQIEILMIVSLVIQILLAFLAPLRKHKANRFLTVLLWLLYLSATPVSLLVAGLIARTIYLRFTVPQLPPASAYYMLWASICLLHLGGSDSITSLSLEDNDLWLRQALQLFTQVFLTLYVFGIFAYYAMEGDGRLTLWLFIATFMFTNGCINYIERIYALYFASREGVRASHNQKAPMTKDNCSGEVDVEKIHVNNEFQIVKHAYFLYEKFRCHLADDVLTLNDDIDSKYRKLFLQRPVNIGLRIIEAELSLMYDIFHTKVFFMSMKRAFLRIACFLLLLASSLLFFISIAIHDFESTNVEGAKFAIGTTLALFTSALLLEIASFVGFLFSDWCIIMVVKLLDDEPSKILQWFLLVSQNWWNRPTNSTAKRWFEKFVPKNKRWSEMCSSYNLLDCSLKHASPNKIHRVICLKQIRDRLFNLLYVERRSIKRSFLEFIFLELRQKASLAGENKEAIRQVCSARGNLVFENNLSEVSTSLKSWTVDVHYSQSLLTWHLATDICYRADSCNDGGSSSGVDYRSVSKQLSDYMAYILLRRPEMVPQLVGKSDDQFEATKSDVIDQFEATKPGTVFKCDQILPQERHLIEDFCTKVLESQSQATERSLSVFHESRCLAQKLNKLGGEMKWKIISKIWVEILCYAAIRSMPRYNFSRLSKGGELITLVWLFMTQLGFLPFKLLD